MNSKMKSIRRYLRPILGLLVTVCFQLSQDSTNAQSLASAPVKIAIQSQTHSINQGEPLEVRCVLLDANNNPTKAPKDLVVNIESVRPSGQTSSTPVTIKAGESSYGFKLPTDEAGIAELRAKQKELLDGGTFIKIKSVESTPVVATNSVWPSERKIETREGLSPSPLSPRLSPSSHLVNFETAPRASGSTTEASTANKSVKTAWAKAGVNFETTPRASGSTTEASTANKSAESTPAVAKMIPSKPAEEFGLILTHQIRRYLADGKDTAVIGAFLVGGVNEYAEDIQVILNSDMGRIISIPLKIHKGEDTAEASLTSDQVGTATVKYIKSNPHIQLRSNNEMKISFAPPITTLELQASPPEISLLEKADLIVRLLGGNKTLVATDEPKQIDVAILAGSGEVSSNVIVIANNSASAHTAFIPTRRGLVKICASTPNLLTGTVEIMVTIPVVLICCSLMGALLGGIAACLVAPARRQHKPGWGVRISVSLIAGFTFYYFGILGFLSHITPVIGLNPVGAIVLSIVGGWLGSEVFELVLKCLGINLGDNRA
jgi:hypothetical protein